MARPVYSRGWRAAGHFRTWLWRGNTAAARTSRSAPPPSSHRSRGQIACGYVGGAGSSLVPGGPKFVNSVTSFSVLCLRTCGVSYGWREDGTWGF